MATNAESHDMKIPGDLLWTKIGKSPYWPCMVVYEPNLAIYTKISKGDRIYYVQFFGEKATRGWTAVKRTFSFEGIARFPFEGIEKYYHVRNATGSCENGNNGSLIKKKVFCINSKHLDIWRGAVSEAEEAFLEVDVKERFRFNVFDYEKTRERNSKNGFVGTCSSTIGKESDIKSTSANNQVSKSNKSKTFPEFEIKKNKCYICAESHSDVTCISCFKRFHTHCLGLLKNPVHFKCWECESGYHNCDYCKRSSAEVKRCRFPKCFKFFHPDCLKKIDCGQPSSHECPNHRCSTCFKENPRNTMARKGPFVTCQLCPFAYHAKESCIPAGCVEDLSNFNIICPLHMTRKRCSELRTYNVSYCVICNQGGRLICCDGCPNAYHEVCLNIRNLCEEFYCDDCTKNKQYYYNMVVWCKVGKYRWWPSKIVQPSEFPVTAKRNIFPGGFPVLCYGTNDYSWTHRGRVIPYEKNHKNLNISPNGAYKLHFKKAITEAEDAYIKYLAYRYSESQCGETPEEYKAIKVNRITDGSLINTPNDCNEEDPCNCKDTDESPCGTNMCINRSTFVECKFNKCQTGQKCQNQRFQKKLYKATKISKTNGRGWGLFAAQSIKKGDFIIEYVGEIITHHEYRRRCCAIQEKADKNFYFLWLDSRRMIDAGPMGNNARFINHSCEPNCEMVKWSVNGDCKIGIFALQNISPGDELSFNYESHKLGFEQECCCQSANCSGVIGKSNKEIEIPIPVVKAGGKGKGKKGKPSHANSTDSPVESNNNPSTIQSSQKSPLSSSSAMSSTIPGSTNSSTTLSASVVNSSGISQNLRLNSYGSSTSPRKKNNIAESKPLSNAKVNSVHNNDSHTSSTLLPSLSPPSSGVRNQKMPIKENEELIKESCHMNKTSGMKRSKQNSVSNSSVKKHCASKLSGSEYKKNKHTNAFVTSNSSESCSKTAISKPAPSIFVVVDSPSKVSSSRVIELNNFSIPIKRIDPATIKYTETVKNKNEGTEKKYDSENFDSNSAKKFIDSISSLQDSLDTVIKSDLYSPGVLPLPQSDLESDEFSKDVNETSSTSKDQSSNLYQNAGYACSKLPKSSQFKRKRQVLQKSPVSRKVPKTRSQDYDSHCFVCKKPESLICCDQEDCKRAYHLYCIGLQDKPDVKT